MTSAGTAQESPKKKSFWNKMKRNTHAVIVGISDYEDPNIPDLQFAHRDAEAFKDFLMSPSGGNLKEENITLLTNEQATGGNVHKAMYSLLKKVQARDKCMIYFSGHGDVETIFQDEPGHLLLYDTPAEIYQINSLRVNDLKRIVTTLSTKNEAEVYLYTDACRSGNLAGSEVNGSQATAAALNSQFSNEVKLMSCQANEYSVEGTEWGDGRGVFSYHLLEGLTGLADTDDDQIVSLQELERYLEDEIDKDLDKHKQSPVVIGDKGTKMAFVHEESLQQLLEEKDMSTPAIEPEEEILALKGTEIDSSNLLELFYQAIADKRLMALDSVAMEGTAAQYYDMIAGDESYASKAPIARGDLISALQDGAQKEINLYLQADSEQTQRRWANDYKYFEVHAHYLNKAVSLLDEFHYLYPQLKAKAIYFETATKRMRLRSEKANPESFASLEQGVQMALSMQPRSPYLFNELGLIYHDQKKYDEAKAAYMKAMEMSPTWAWPYNNLFELFYSGKKDYQKAIEYSLKGLKQKETFATFHEQIAYAYFQLGKLDSAIIYEHNYVELRPNSCNALNDLAAMHNMNNNIEQAIELFRKSIECDSTSHWAYENLSWILVERGDLDFAEEILNRAIRNEVLTANILGNLGRVNELRGQNDLAIDFYQRAIENDSTVNVWEELVLLQLKSGRLTEAREKLIQYISNIGPEKKFGYFNLACLNAIERDLEAFENNLLKATELEVINKKELDDCKYFDGIRKEEAFIRLYEQLPD